MNQMTQREKKENMIRSLCSKIGVSLLLLMILCSFLSVGLSVLVQKAIPDILSKDANTVTAVQMIVRFLPFCVLGYPVMKLSLKEENSEAASIGVIGAQKVNWFELMKLGIISMAAVYIAGYLSLLCGWTLSFVKVPFAISVPSPFVPAPLITTVLLYCVLITIVEEFVFRGVIFKQMIRFGAEAAIFSTAFLYAVNCGDLDKFFSVFLTGVIYAYIVLHTSSIKKAIALHIAVNLLSYVILPQIAIKLGRTGSIVMAAFLIVVVVVGVLLFFFDFRKKLFVDRSTKERNDTAQAMECFWGNAGVLIFVLFSLLKVAGVLF